MNIDIKSPKVNNIYKLNKIVIIEEKKSYKLPFFSF